MHERFTADQLRGYRADHPGIKIIAHPECPPDVLAEADYVGSTSGMINYVEVEKPASVVMVTECSMAANVAVQHPETRFEQPCNLCPHMKRITLPKIYDALVNMEPRIEIDPAVAERARLSVERMLAIR